MTGPIDVRQLEQVRREWDDLAQAVKDGNPAALRGCGTATFLRGGAMDVYERSLEADVQFVVRTLAAGPDERVLEVGCGNCVFLARLAAAARMTVGVDVSDVILRYGRDYLKRAGRTERSHVLQAPMQALPFRSGSFDMVLVSACLQYVPRPEVPLVLAELVRVKTPRGVILLTQLPLRSCLSERRAAMIQFLRNVKRRCQGRPLVPYWRVSVTGLRGQLRRAGLTIVEEGTTRYNFYPLPSVMRRRLRDQFEPSRTFSRLFSNEYYFLCQ